MDYLEERFQRINEAESQQAALIESMKAYKQTQIAEKEIIKRYKEILAIVNNTHNYMELGEKVKDIVLDR